MAAKPSAEPRTLEELEEFDHRCLVYSNRPVSEQGRFRAEDGWRSVRVDAQRLISNNGAALRDGAIARLGLAVLPTFMASDAIVRGDLKAVASDHPLAEPSIYAVWPPGRQLSAEARALVEALSDRFGPLPYWDQAIDQSRLLS